MKALVLAAGTKLRKSTLVRGSKVWSATSASWTVPEGVYSICVGMIAGGHNATTSASGKGGNFRYINDIPVTPGQVILLTAGNNNQQSKFGAYTTDDPLGGEIKGANGTAGASVPVDGISQGGNAGGTGAGRAGKGLNLVNGVITPANASASNGANYGGGGGCYRGKFATAYGGAPGQVRVIWGQGRAFPNTGLVD